MHALNRQQPLGLAAWADTAFSSMLTAEQWIYAHTNTWVCVSSYMATYTEIVQLLAARATTSMYQACEDTQLLHCSI